jgi:hypothetical protein
MTSPLFKLATLTLLPAAVLTSASCSHNATLEQMGGTEKTTVVETSKGVVVVDTLTITATVKAIDAATRKITLVAPNGAKTVYQIKVGDQVKAVVTEEVAVFLGKGATPDGMGATTVALAPVGAKPGGVIVNTEQVTVMVTAVNVGAREVTLQLPDGTSKTVKVNDKVDLAKVRPGDDVTAQVSEGLAISVTKP